MGEQIYFGYGEIFKMIKCLDCGKQLNEWAKYKSNTRCSSCSAKYRFICGKNPMIGKRWWETTKINPRYIKGETENNTCSCGRRIWFGSEKCSSCWGKCIENELNPNWNGGVSRIPYSIAWTNKLKELIRIRDGHKCQICSNIGKQVHHIDYDKQNCNENNLITLCRKCHCRTNFNRDYWYAYFIYLKEIINGCL
jgi:hypothetical protein